MDRWKNNESPMASTSQPDEHPSSPNLDSNPESDLLISSSNEKGQLNPFLDPPSPSIRRSPSPSEETGELSSGSSSRTAITMDRSPSDDHQAGSTPSPQSSSQTPSRSTTSGSSIVADADTEADRRKDNDMRQSRKDFPSYKRPTVHYPEKIASEREISTFSLPTYDSDFSLAGMQDSKSELSNINTSSLTSPGSGKPRKGISALGSIPRVDSGDMLSGNSSKAPSLAGTDDEEEEELYDWSDEDDLVDEEAKFEQKIGIKQNKRRSGCLRVITFFLSTLIGSTLLAGVIATPPILLTTLYLPQDRSSEREYRVFTISAWMLWVASNLPISWALGFIVDIAPGVYTWFKFLVWGHISEGTKSRLELYMSLKDTAKPVLYAASVWVSWVIIFEDIYQLYDSNNPSDSRAPYTPRMFQVVEFFFFLALLICAQRMLSHMIAFAFHRTAYQDRIQTLRKALATIDHLRDYRPKRNTERHRPFSGAFTFGHAHTRTPLWGVMSPGQHDKVDGVDYFSAGKRSSRLGVPVEVRSEDEKGSGTDTNVDTDTELQPRRSEKEMKRLSKEHRDNEKGKRKPWSLGIPRPSRAKVRISPTESNASTTTAMNSSREASPLAARAQHTYPPLPSQPDTPSSLRFETQPVAASKRQRSQSPSPSTALAGATPVMTAAKAIKAAMLHDARNMFSTDNEEVAGLGWNVSSAHEAKRLARSIYTAFKADRRRNYLIPEDFNDAYATPEEAREAFRVFDKDNNGDITRAEIKTALLKFYKERRFLSRSMRDVSAALRTLDQLMLVFTLVIQFFISLSIFGVNISQSLTSVYSIVIAASFFFKNAASNMFDAIMFLFVTHPFDTGDRCFIDDENMVVKKMGLFATVFTRVDGTESYYFNSQLFAKFIINCRRSGNTAENLTMQVHWRTPLEKLDALGKCMNEWLQTEENRWFEPSTSVTLQKIDFQRHLEITIGIGHNGNWQ